MRILAIIWIAVGFLEATAQSIHVGLYQDHLINAAVVYCSVGEYKLVTDGTVVSRMEAGDILYLTLEDSMIKVLDADQDFGHCKLVEMRGLSAEAVFRIRPIKPELESRMYDDALVVSADDRFMTLVNHVDIDKYLAGVVEAETGASAEKEFYKSQSILCRTFALQNLDRHQSERFSAEAPASARHIKRGAPPIPRFWSPFWKPRVWWLLITILNSSQQPIIPTAVGKPNGRQVFGLPMWITFSR